MFTLPPKSVTLALLLSLAVLPFSLTAIVKPLNGEVELLDDKSKPIEEFDEIEEVLGNEGYKADGYLEQVLNELKSIGQTLENGEERNNDNLYASGRNHSLILGHPTWRDRLVVNHEVYVPSKLWRKVTKLIVYPHPSLRPNVTISAIHAVDRRTDGTGAYPSITSGGLGRKSVIVKLVSQRSHGIHYNIKIYGH